MKTLTSMGNQTKHSNHSKSQIPQVNKMTKAVTKLTLSQNHNKLAARPTFNPENLANSDFEDDDEENDIQNRVIIHKIVCILYIMRTTWQHIFCLIRRLHHHQQQVGQKMTPWILHLNNFQNLAFKIMKFG